MSRRNKSASFRHSLVAVRLRVAPRLVTPTFVRMGNRGPSRSANHKAIVQRNLRLSKQSTWIGFGKNDMLQSEQPVQATLDLESLVEARVAQLSLKVKKLESELVEKRVSEIRLQRLAHFDTLTGLPNRLLLSDRCKYAMTLAQRSCHSVALVFLDLDHFKKINDSFGHCVGDKVLVEFANRLKSIVREQDTLSRLGGDEFVLLLPNTDAAGASHVAGKILSVVQPPFLIGCNELVISPSIGIALYPQDSQNYEDLSRCADAAMYRAKETGRSSYKFYTKEIQTASVSGRFARPLFKWSESSSFGGVSDR